MTEHGKYEAPGIVRTIKSETLLKALEWQERGFRVLPLASKSKKTLRGSHGSSDATTDRKQLLEWFRNGSQFNLGVALDDHLLIDLDVRPDKGIDGTDAFVELCEQELIPEGAYTARTPSGGTHVVLQLPDGFALPTQEGELSPGLEWRTGNTYFVSAPSRFEGEAYSGGYKEQGGDPDIELPMALLIKIRETIKPKPDRPAKPKRECTGEGSAYGLKALSDEVELVANAGGEGNSRHDTLFKAAARLGELVAGGELPQSRAKASLLDACDANGLMSEGREKEVLRTIQNGLDKGAANPRSAPRDSGPAQAPEPTPGPWADDWPEDEADPESERKPPSPPLRRLLLSEVWTQSIPETPWIVPGWIAANDRIMVIGSPKAGKSTMLSDLAVALTTGGEWLGQQIQGGPYRIVYIDEEQAEVLARQRMKRIMAGRGVRQDQADLLDENLIYLHRNSLNLDTPSRLEKLHEALHQHRPALVLVDSFKRIHGRQENDNSELGAFLTDVLDPLLASADCGAVILHHPRKGDVKEDNVMEAARGAGVISDYADTIMGFVRDGANRKLLIAASRWDDLGSPVLVERKLDGDSLLLIGTDAGDRAEDVVRRSLRSAAEDGMLRAGVIEAIHEELSIDTENSKRAATRALGKLYGNGDASKEKDGKEMRYWLREYAPPTADNTIRA